MFNKILIANRSEIACRIIKTAQRLGIATVAVYAPDEINARHVQLADQAYLLTGIGRQCYLNADAILAIAKQAGAEAIHPGYGFLSENAEFATQCEAAGIVFIGPPAAAIAAMGSKITAKFLMAKAGIPLVPSYYQGQKDFVAAAEEMGYPVLIKAAAGGGGKGMRVVSKAADLADALQSATREAKTSFNDGTLLLEKYLINPRHIEIQIFADQLGQVIHLGERDCSIQRRYQKVLEEAPAPGLSTTIRQAMAAMAVTAARAVNYVGAGTVECLLDHEGCYYFMEMNTRLQVEHPVTEMITGQDLVEWQLRVAAGEPLPLKQEQIIFHGHAFEARIYAEDPAQQFLPQRGVIQHLRIPEGTTLRFDHGLSLHDEIGIHYDPMLGKLISWGETRANALKQLQHGLASLEIAGVVNNLNFLRAICQVAAYQQGLLTTDFIAQNHTEIVNLSQLSFSQDLILACLFVLLDQRRIARPEQMALISPWVAADGWRLNHHTEVTLIFYHEANCFHVRVEYHSTQFIIMFDNQTHIVSGELHGSELNAEIDGHRLQATIIADQFLLTILHYGSSRVFKVEQRFEATHAIDLISGSLCSPMPGIVVAVSIKIGDAVQPGQALMVLEAMKMEHVIRATVAGKVDEIYFKVGDQVKEGVELLRIV